MPSCFETPRHSASKTRVNALKARLLSMRASRDTWLELTPTPRSPPVTRGMGPRHVGGDPVGPAGPSASRDSTQLFAKGRIAGAGNDGRGVPPQSALADWGSHNCRSRVNPRIGGSALLGGVLVLALLAGEDSLGNEAGVLPDRGLDLGGDVGIGLEERLGVLAALADALAVIGEPGARLLDDARLHAEVDQLAALRHAFAVHDVELDLLERRRELVLDDLDAGLVGDHLVPLLARHDPAGVDAHRGLG